MVEHRLVSGMSQKSDAEVAMAVDPTRDQGEDPLAGLGDAEEADGGQDESEREHELLDEEEAEDG